MTSEEMFIHGEENTIRMLSSSIAVKRMGKRNLRNNEHQPEPSYSAQVSRRKKSNNVGQQFKFEWWKQPTAIK
jgi:hypothetical protein